VAAVAMVMAVNNTCHSDLHWNNQFFYVNDLCSIPGPNGLMVVWFWIWKQKVIE